MEQMNKLKIMTYNIIIIIIYHANAEKEKNEI